MQVDNQTLTEIVKNAVQSTIKPDYFGWALGIVGVIVGILAIYITILIYKKQTRLTKEFEKLRKDAIHDALKRIEQSLIRCKKDIEVQFKQVENPNLDMRSKVQVAESMMFIINPSYEHFADNIMKEADFVRLDVETDLYEKLRFIQNDLREYVDEKTLHLGQSSDPKHVFGTWYYYGSRIINNSDAVILEINKKLTTS